MVSGGVAPGVKYSNLTVLKPTRLKNTDRRSMWWCICDCGKEVLRSEKLLKNGESRSCGCLRQHNRKRLPTKQAAINGVLGDYKRSAARASRLWELTDEQALALFQSPCYYCGTPPSSVCVAGKYNGSFNYNGIDRIDNTLGYSHENTVPCCKTCNLAKRNQTLDDFIAWIYRVHDHLKRTQRGNQNQ